MPIIEIVGATTIAIIIFSEFLAAIGIAITLYKIYGVTRRFNSQPAVHHHHHYQNESDSEEHYSQSYDGTVDFEEVPDNEETQDHDEPITAI